MFLVLSTFLLGAMTSCEKDEPKKEETFNTYAASGVENGHEYVDLGLPTKWATVNIEGRKGRGFVLAEDKEELAKSWGGKWRMPTNMEVFQLVTMCKWEIVFKDGKCGYRVTSNTNGKSLFVPTDYDRDESGNLTNLYWEMYMWDDEKVWQQEINELYIGNAFYKLPEFDKASYFDYKTTPSAVLFLVFSPN